MFNYQFAQKLDIQFHKTFAHTIITMRYTTDVKCRTNQTH